MSEMPESATAVEVPPLTLGWRLQMSMAHAHHTRQSLADALGVSIATITRWTSDKGTPKRAYITQWAWLTRVPIEWLEHGIQRSPDFGGPTRSNAGGADVTTSGWSDARQVSLAAITVLPLTGSHVKVWQLPATGRVATGAPNTTEGSSARNECTANSVRITAQGESSAAEIAPDRKVAA